jgi:hypothetical protein
VEGRYAHRPETGAAKSRSPKGTDRSPSYKTTPRRKSSPEATANFRRSGEEESAGPSVLIDLDLDRSQKLGYSLDLVENGVVQAPHESHGIAQGSFKGSGLVQSEVAAVPSDQSPDQGRLPALPRPGDKDHGCVLQRLADLLRGEPWKKVVLGRHVAHGWSSLFLETLGILLIWARLIRNQSPSISEAIAG